MTKFLTQRWLPMALLVIPAVCFSGDAWMVRLSSRMHRQRIISYGQGGGGGKSRIRSRNCDHRKIPRMQLDSNDVIKTATDDTAAAAAASAPVGSVVAPHTVEVAKPMGLLLEEKEGRFITIVDILDDGSVIRDDSLDLCIHDEILAVDGVAISADSTLEDTMALIAAAPGPMVALTLQRSPDAVAVRFDNGIKIAAAPGTHLCNLAFEARTTSIEYSCRSGSCGTCEQLIVDEATGRSKSVRPCVATVPRGIDRIRVSASNRLAP